MCTVHNYTVCTKNLNVYLFFTETVFIFYLPFSIHFLFLPENIDIDTFKQQFLERRTVSILIQAACDILLDLRYMF